MPYTVTTTRYLPSMESHEAMEYAERRAVTTLDEARSYAFRQIVNHWPDKKVGEGPDLTALSEAGGTIGPLPDGTVIEVEYIDSWYSMALLAGFAENHNRNGSPALYAAIAGHDQIIDAYNK